MTYDMGAETLSLLTKQTTFANDDLGAQVRALFVTDQPLDGLFNGTARAAFDQFKTEMDRLAGELNAALASVRDGIAGQDLAWVSGEEDMAASYVPPSVSIKF